MTGRAAQDPLKVRVFDQDNPSASVAGVNVRFEALSGGLFVNVPSANKSVTNSAGEASIRYVAGIFPGSNTVRASIPREEVNDPSVPTPSPVNFSIEAQSPTVSDASTVGLCNIMPGTSEFPGSALPKLFQIRFRDNNGQPKSGEVIIAEAYEPNAVDATPFIGTFLPRVGVTDSNGIATFAFVISTAARTGPFTIKFSTPQFYGSDRKRISISVNADVRDPANKPRGVGDTEINFDDPPRAGQAQVGLPGQRIGVALRGRFFAPGNPGGGGNIVFFILEGDGTFEPGPEGTPVGFLTDPNCGKLRLAMNCDPQPESGIASAYFTLAEGTTHALIAMEGFTDVFAIGPPEVSVVDGQGVEQALIQPSRSPESGSAATFQLEFRLPVNFSGPVAGKLESFDQGGTPITGPGFTGQEVVDDIQMTVVDPNVDGRYSRFRSSSSTPFVLYDGSAFPQGSPPGLQGRIGIRSTPNGHILPSRKLSPAVAGPLVVAAQEIQDTIIQERGEPFSVRFKPPAGAGAVTWKIKSDAPGATEVPLTGAVTPTLTLTFVDDAANANPAAAQPSLFLDRVAANARASFTVTATFAGAPPLTETILVSLGRSGPGLVGAPLRPGALPATDAALTTEYRAFFGIPMGGARGVNEPTPVAGGQYEARRFIPLPTTTPAERANSQVAMNFFDSETGRTGTPTASNATTGTGLQENRRIVYTDPPAGAPALRTMGRAWGLAIASPSIVPVPFAAPTSFNFGRALTYGVAITGRVQFELDLIDLGHVVAHEQAHCQHNLDMDTPGSSSEGDLLRAVLMSVANSFFTGVPVANQTPANRRNVGAVAFSAAVEVDEVLVTAAQITAHATDNASYFLVKGDMEYLAQKWERLLTTLTNGKAFAGGKLEIEDQARTDVIERMKTIYDSLPPYARRMQGGDYFVDTGEATVTSTISPQILKPAP